MSKIDQYNDIFVKALSVDLKELNDLKYNDVQSWDSIGHMGLMSEIEETFNIFLEVDDIINFSSYKEGIMILKRYNVEL